MDNYTNHDDQLNVIKFTGGKSSIDSEVLFPSSKRYHEISDDPIMDLLGEFEEVYSLDVYEYQRSHIELPGLSYKDCPHKMISKIEQRIKIIKDRSLRIKYYLNEMK